MRYGKMMAVTVLGAFVAVAPFAPQAQTTKDKIEVGKEPADRSSGQQLTHHGPHGGEIEHGYDQRDTDEG